MAARMAYIARTDLIARVEGVDEAVLERALGKGWLAPSAAGAASDAEELFEEIDVARVALIRDLERDLALDAGAIDVILPLLDQLHELRAALARLSLSLAAEPAETRRRLARRLAALDADTSPEDSD